MAVMRWDPFREFETLEREMDRFWGGAPFRRLPWRSGDLTSWSPALDVWETADALMVRAALPGVAPEDVEVSVAEGVLTIKGQLQRKDEKENDRFHHKEIQYGSFQRTVSLPPTADTEAAQAHFEHGVLTLTFPKREQARTKVIPITGAQAGQTPTIEGKAETADRK